MVRRGLLMALTLVGACTSGPAPTPAPAQTRTQPRTQAGEVSVAAGAVAPRPVVALDEAATAQIHGLAGRFRGGKVCDVEALAELEGLQARHGEPAEVREALLLAFSACDEPEGIARLLVRTLPVDASLDDRLRVGAAWIRAAHYEEAVEVLLPLAESEGPTSKAAWLAGFALFHAGDSERALPLLQSARAQASAPGGSDGPLLVGLAKLHSGDTEGAIAELEQGRTVDPDNVAILAGLARAYTAAGREAEAAEASQAARAANVRVAERERTNLRLSAYSTELKAAHAAGDVEEVERLFDEMWPTAPPPARQQMLLLRADAYERAGRSDDASASRTQAAEIRAEASP
jgi:thioredoxin-like negative regulator of GroEL